MFSYSNTETISDEDLQHQSDYTDTKLYRCEREFELLNDDEECDEVVIRNKLRSEQRLSLKYKKFLNKIFINSKPKKNYRIRIIKKF